MFPDNAPLMAWTASCTSVTFSPRETAGTPRTRNVHSLACIAIPPGEEPIAGWRLERVLLVQLTPWRRKWIATTWLEGLEEFGEGATREAAVRDLVVSMGEYRESLERRQDRLAPSAQKELAYLARLISRADRSP